MEEGPRPGDPDFGKREVLPPPPEMIELIELTKSAECPMVNNVQDSGLIMNLAEEKGCKVFVLVCGEFYLEDKIQVMREDLNFIRRFW